MTFLQHVGSFLKSIFTKETEVATALEPIVDVAFPGIATLYSATVQAVATAEAAGEVAATQTGNGAAKLAAVTAAIEPIAVGYLKSQGINATPAQLTAWVNAVVATLNALPAPTASTTA